MASRFTAWNEVLGLREPTVRRSWRAVACLDYRLRLSNPQREGPSAHRHCGDRYGLRHMPRAPPVTGRCGWVVVAQRGSHAQLKRPDRGGRVTVPLHAGETIGPKLLLSILHQAGLRPEVGHERRSMRRSLAASHHLPVAPPVRVACTPMTPPTGRCLSGR